MLPLVETSAQNLEPYANFVSCELLDEIRDIARGLKGLKVFHVNSTPRGGGVAEILKSLVPLMRGTGLSAEWYTIPPRNSFFSITKAMHNALQGKKCKFPFSARKQYLFHMARTADLMRDMKPDIWIIHDPQPAGLILFLPQLHPSIARLHVDLTSPNKEVWRFVSGLLANYDSIVVSSPEFIKKEIQEKAVVFQPAIDPLTAKNQPMPPENASEIVKSFGINPDRPLISQISRFDQWKDPISVIRAYQEAKKKIPDLQLALAGLFLALDDPEAGSVYKKVEKAARKDPDIFLFSGMEKIGSLRVDDFVNALQTASDIIVQKSIREGFGLTVAEAMWKEKPVIGGNIGGIKTQIVDGKNGFLVSTISETAERIVQIIENPKLCEQMGKEARQTVREKFLMPRLLLDYLRLFKNMCNLK